MWTRVAILIGIISMVALTPCLADELIVPFGVHVEEFKAEALERGLDLYDGDGFVENKGMKIHIFTYKFAEINTLNLIKELTAKHRRI